MGSKYQVGIGAALVLLSLAAPALAYTYKTQVTLKEAGDASTVANTGTLVIGDTGGKQIALDDNEIQARAEGGGATTLFLQHGGGKLHVGSSWVDFASVPTMFYVGGFQAMTFEEFGSSLNVKIAGDIHTVFSPTYLYEGVSIFEDLILADAPISSGSVLCMGGGGTVGVCPSSRAFKRDIVELGRGLTEVMAMRPVTFTWKEDGRPDIGFIAEEALGVLPDLVARDEHGTVRTFNYQGYTAVLTRAVQEQEDTITALRSELTTQTRDFGRKLDELHTEVANRDRELDAQGEELRALRRQFAELASAVAGLQKRSPAL